MQRGLQIIEEHSNSQVRNSLEKVMSGGMQMSKKRKLMMTVIGVLVIIVLGFACWKMSEAVKRNSIIDQLNGSTFTADDGCTLYFYGRENCEKNGMSYIWEVSYDFESIILKENGQGLAYYFDIGYSGKSIDSLKERYINSHKDNYRIR